jgi:hypothetical protein
MLQFFFQFIDLDDNSCPIISYSPSDSNNNNITSQKQKKFLQLLNTSNSSGTSMFDMRNSYYNGSQPKSFSESGSSTSSLSDLDDITIVKEEPLSPHSSCPPSPNSNYNNPLPSISSINPDLMYDRKVRVQVMSLPCNCVLMVSLFPAIITAEGSASIYLSNLLYITNQNGTASVQ